MLTYILCATNCFLIVVNVIISILNDKEIKSIKTTLEELVKDDDLTK